MADEDDQILQITLQDASDFLKKRDIENSLSIIMNMLESGLELTWELDATQMINPVNHQQPNPAYNFYQNTNYNPAVPDQIQMNTPVDNELFDFLANQQAEPVQNLMNNPPINNQMNNPLINTVKNPPLPRTPSNSPTKPFIKPANEFNTATGHWPPVMPPANNINQPPVQSHVGINPAYISTGQPLQGTIYYQPPQGSAQLTTGLPPPPSGIIQPPATGLPPPPSGIIQPPATGLPPPPAGMIQPHATGLPPPPPGMIQPPATGLPPPPSGIIQPPSGFIRPNSGILPPKMIPVVASQISNPQSVYNTNINQTNMSNPSAIALTQNISTPPTIQPYQTGAPPIFNPPLLRQPPLNTAFSTQPAGMPYLPNSPYQFPPSQGLNPPYNTPRS